MQASKIRLRIRHHGGDIVTKSKRHVNFYFLEVDPEKTLADLSSLFGTEYVRALTSRGKADNRNGGYFFTWDKEGKKSVGKLTTKIGDVLKNLDTIYVSYQRMLNRQWEDMTYKKTGCDLCGSHAFGGGKPHFIQTYEEYMAYCNVCFSKVKDLRIHECINCGVHGPLEAAVDKYLFTMYIAKCSDSCEKKEIKLKECQTCGLPLMKAKKCGGCGSVMYCSIECQKKDWPEHKLTCGKN